MKNEKRKFKMKIKILFFVSIALLLSFMVYKQNGLLLVKNTEVCIHSPFVYEDYVNLRYRTEELEIEGSVNTEVLGEYRITYRYNNKVGQLKVNVIDKLKPEFDLIEKTIIEGQSITPEELVSNLVEDSLERIEFVKAYDLTQIGDHIVEVRVVDQNKNSMTKKTTVHVEKKDEIPPVMQGLEKISVYQGAIIDFYSGVSAIDNQDPEPSFTIDIASLNDSKPGVYEIYYIATDRQGNSASYARIVEILKIKPTKEKVIYLTVDDGPSQNTPEILDILDRYGAKATFFVTGACPEYYPYIKIAHDKGHTIGMHTYCHNYGMIYSSDQAYIDDLNKITDIVEEQIGYRPNIFRFPGGSSNTVSANYNEGIITRLVDYAHRNQWVYYDWNADIGDGNSGMLAEDLIHHAIESGQDIKRIVMLMHDGRGSSESVKALPAIIEYYMAQGYTFKAIDESAPTAHHRVAN